MSTRNGQDELIEQRTVAYTTGGIFLNGHRTRETFRRDNPEVDKPCQAADCVADYTFDARERLTRERVTRQADGTVVSDSTYTLDVAGNVTAQTADGDTTAFAYEGNQLQWIDPVDGPRQFHHHDARGNLACVTLNQDPAACGDIATGNDDLPQGVLAAYAWDPFDRLEAFRSFAQDPDGVADPEPDSHAAYTHDPLDRITAQTETHDGDDTGEKTTAFTYLALTANVVTEHQTDLDDQPITTKSYRYDAFARLVGMTNTPTDPDRGGEEGTFTYSFDVHGSVSALMDEQGGVHAAYGYTAYGADNEQLSAGDGDVHDPLNPYRYTAKRIDTGTGSLDMGARRFGPDTGRFLSRDRYQGALDDLGLGHDPLTGNRYALAAGNPLSFVEVDGHAVSPDGGGGSAPTPAPLLTDSWDRALTNRTGGSSTGSSTTAVATSVRSRTGSGGDGWGSVNSFVRDHKADINAIGISGLVGTACGITFGVATFGAGMVGCGMLAGAAYGIVHEGLDTPAEEQTLAGYSDSFTRGSITGAAGTAIAGVGGTAATGGVRPAITAAQRQSSNLITSTRSLLTRNTGNTTPQEIPSVIYRGGGRSPSNLRLRPGEEALSFRDSLSNPYPLKPGQRPVLEPGKEYIGIDTSQLPPGSVVPDNVPPGHVSVYVDDVDLLRSSIIEKVRFPK